MELTDVLHVDTNSQKLEVGVGKVKYEFGQSGHWTLKQDFFQGKFHIQQNLKEGLKCS